MLAFASPSSNRALKSLKRFEGEVERAFSATARRKREQMGAIALLEQSFVIECRQSQRPDAAIRSNDVEVAIDRERFARVGKDLCNPLQCVGLENGSVQRKQDKFAIGGILGEKASDLIGLEGNPIAFIFQRACGPMGVALAFQAFQRYVDAALSDQDHPATQIAGVSFGRRKTLLPALIVRHRQRHRNQMIIHFGAQALGIELRKAADRGRESVGKRNKGQRAIR